MATIAILIECSRCRYQNNIGRMGPQSRCFYFFCTPGKLTRTGKIVISVFFFENSKRTLVLFLLTKATFCLFKSQLLSYLRASICLIQGSLDSAGYNPLFQKKNAIFVICVTEIPVFLQYKYNALLSFARLGNRCTGMSIKCHEQKHWQKGQQKN